MSFEDPCRVQGPSEPLYSSYESQTCEGAPELQRRSTDEFVQVPVSTNCLQQDDHLLNRAVAWLGKRPNEDFRDFLHRKTRWGWDHYK